MILFVTPLSLNWDRMILFVTSLSLNWDRMILFVTSLFLNWERMILFVTLLSLNWDRVILCRNFCFAVANPIVCYVDVYLESACSSNILIFVEFESHL